MFEMIRSTECSGSGSASARAWASRCGASTALRFRRATSSALSELSVPRSLAPPPMAATSVSSVPEPQNGSYTVSSASGLASWTSRLPTTGLTDAGMRCGFA